MTGVLMVMRQGTVALGHIEAQDAEGDGANELFLERTFLLVGLLVKTLSCEQVVLALVELFLDFSAEHLTFYFVFINQIISRTLIINYF